MLEVVGSFVTEVAWHIVFDLLSVALQLKLRVVLQLTT